MPERELYFISGSPPCWTVMLALKVGLGVSATAAPERDFALFDQSLRIENA